MRKIKSYFFISLDGVVESPEKWHFPYFDDEMRDAVGAGFSSADALLMGRVLYEAPRPAPPVGVGGRAPWPAVDAPGHQPVGRELEARVRLIES